MKAMLRGLSATVVGAIVIAALAVAPASANGALKADLRRDISGELHGFVMFNTTRPDEIRVHVSIKSASPSVEGSHQFIMFVYQGCENQHYDAFNPAFVTNGAGNGNFHVVVSKVAGATSEGGGGHVAGEPIQHRSRADLNTASGVRGGSSLGGSGALAFGSAPTSASESPLRGVSTRDPSQERRSVRRVVVHGSGWEAAVDVAEPVLVRQIAHRYRAAGPA